MLYLLKQSELFDCVYPTKTDTGGYVFRPKEWKRVTEQLSLKGNLTFILNEQRDRKFIDEVTRCLETEFSKANGNVMKLEEDEPKSQVNLCMNIRRNDTTTAPCQKSGHA
jgi:hypothetical protein